MSEQYTEGCEISHTNETERGISKRKSAPENY